MALITEKRKDYEEAVTDMRLLDETVKTKGWQEIILPFLTDKRTSAINSLLLKAEDMNELYKARAAIEVIDDMISDPSRKIEGNIDRRIREGQEAAEILSKEPDEPEEDKE